ncbi:Aste57867_11797 [Aphanomyces stellatus]|uniref:Aste57867_11797 protein n=1 Tax=Aphanomyces stellatus TaxID=120398 RepID=A0A485KV42_9STRA|nr:hypothetical protein As57867_011752 [Aphanomyces stellatus]VFT88652.1 Aste57867_11797 [Aphanomyces stellatus]
MSLEFLKVFNTTSTDFQGLVLDTAAFIHEAPAVVETFSAVVRSNSTLLVDAFTWKEAQSTNNVKALAAGFQFMWDNNSSISFDADYIVDIYVPSNVLQSIKLTGSGNVVVYPHVLANVSTQSLVAQVTGSGSLYVQEAAITLNHLALGVSGSGDIQFNVPDTKLASVLNMSISGSGNIALATTSLLANSVDSSNSGSGKMYVEASNAIKISSSVSTSVSGSGQINYYDVASSCGLHTIIATGSGSINGGALTCSDTKVGLSGSGSVVTSSMQSLIVINSGSGSVSVVGGQPPIVSGPISIATSDPARRASLAAFPGYKPSHYSIHVSRTDFTWVVALVVGVLVALLACIFGWRCYRRRNLLSNMASAGPFGEAATPISDAAPRFAEAEEQKTNAVTRAV